MNAQITMRMLCVGRFKSRNYSYPIVILETGAINGMERCLLHIDVEIILYQ